MKPTSFPRQKCQGAIPIVRVRGRSLDLEVERSTMPLVVKQSRVSSVKGSVGTNECMMQLNSGADTTMVKPPFSE